MYTHILCIYIYIYTCICVYVYIYIYIYIYGTTFCRGSAETLGAKDYTPEITQEWNSVGKSQ